MVIRRSPSREAHPAATVAPGGSARGRVVRRGLDAGGGARGCVSTPVPDPASTVVCATSSSSRSRLPRSTAMLGSLAAAASATGGGLAPSRALSVSSQRLSGAGPLGCPSLTRMASIRSAICSALCQRLAGSARRARLMSRSTSGFKSRDHLRRLLGPRAPHLHDDVRVRRPVEGLPSGGEEVEHRAHREQIRAPVERPGLRLLGRHVRELPLDDAGGRLLASCRRPWRCRSPPASPRPAG